MAVVLPEGKQSFTTASGAPAVGYKLYTYEPGTSTPKDTYTTSAGNVPNANPVVMDARGEATIFWSGAYKVVLKDAADVTIWTVDGMETPEVAGSAATLRADMANVVLAAKGAALVGDGPLMAYPAGTVGASLHDVGISVNAVSGVDPTGVADSTAVLNAFFAGVPDGSVVRFCGAYKIGQVVMNGKNLVIDARGSTFNLTGSSAGFLVKGTVTRFAVVGGLIVGDGTNRDGALSTIQIGWSFGNEASANVQNIVVQDVRVEAANIGFKFAAGTGGGSGPCYNVKISNCHAKDIVGTVGGNGYGFQFSQASYSSIVQCSADNCQRHGIYFAEGRNYTATDCIIKNHRSTVAISAYRVAMSISRSRNVTVRGCVFDNCYDGTVEIDVDTAGTAPDNVSTGTVLSGCVFLDSALADIRIGTAPATDGLVRDVLISNCVMVRKASNTISSIVVEGAERLKITDCLIDASTSAATVRAISLNGTDGDTYTNDIEIVRNTIHSANVGVQIPSVTQLGSSRVRVMDNNIVATSAELEFVSGEDATTNNNLIYNRTSGKNATKTCTTTGAGVTIPVGGLDVLTMSPGAALTVLQFSGAVEGQVLTLFFGNANTTLLNTNFYLAGGVNFVSTSNDTLTLVYGSGAWRELSRSIN